MGKAKKQRLRKSSNSFKSLPIRHMLQQGQIARSEDRLKDVNRLLKEVDQNTNSLQGALDYMKATYGR